MDQPPNNDDPIKMLYIGNLSPFVTEQALREIFQSVGALREVKIIRDKKTGQGNGYGFIVFEEEEAAERAVQTLDGRLLFNQAMRVNWAYQSQNREELKNHFQIFVGDLGNTVTDSMLMQAFTQLGLTPSDARVMWDNSTGRSRGYGFVSFRTHEEATRAIEAMNGQFIGSRRVRCGWAQHKQEQEPAQLSYDAVHQQDPTNVNVYVGNVSADVSDTELRRQFAKYGTITEVKIQRKGGYGFVRFQNHEDACKAICQMSGQTIGGRTLKCSWGKVGNPMMSASPMVGGMGMPPMMHGQGPMYMPGPQGGPPMMMGPQGGMPPMPGQPPMPPSMLPGMMMRPGVPLAPGPGGQQPGGMQGGKEGGPPGSQGMPGGPMQGQGGPMGDPRGGPGQGPMQGMPQGQGPKGPQGMGLGGAPGAGPSGMFFAFSGNPYMNAARPDGQGPPGAPPTN